MKYFFIGERELVLAFALAGVHGKVAVTRDEALDAFNHLIGKGENIAFSQERVKVLIVTDDIAVLLEEELLEWQKSGEYPLVVEIPGLQGRLEGKKSLTEAIREAIGIRV